MSEEVNNRTDYGLNEDDMSFKSSKSSSLFKNVSDDFATIHQNPIYQVLSSFESEYLKNERYAYELFLQLNEALDTFNGELSNYPSYDNMDIVRLFKDILVRYQNWVSIMRQNILMAAEKMSQVEKEIEENYIPNYELDNFKEECKMQLDEIERRHQQELKKKIQEGKEGVIYKGFKKADGRFLIAVPKSKAEIFVDREEVLIKKILRGDSE